MLAYTLKTTALAALLGLGVVGTSGTAASAYTSRTRCDGDACVRLQCNNDGYDCFRIGYIDRDGYDRTYSSYDRPYGYYDQPYSYTTRTYTYTPGYSDDDAYGPDYDAGPYGPPPPDAYDYPD
ncbi:MAG TPA: hypothetical protein VKR31_01875 [Rhizomicrobium sp.]|nr:hypothetical protein [Rhizomicrobium sp.]